MKFALAAATAALLLTAQTVTADAKGCIKGALVGGAALVTVRWVRRQAVLLGITTRKEAAATARATERLKPLIKTLCPKKTGRA